MPSLPPVPARQDPETQFFLEKLRSLVLGLQKKLGGDDETSTGSVSDSTFTEFEPIYAAMSTLADQGTGTEGAWATLASSAPADSRYAIIIFEVSSTDDADIGDLKWRTENGAAEILAVYVSGDEDDASPRMMCFVPLDTSGQFQYKFTNSSTTTINWSITYCGYVL